MRLFKELSQSHFGGRLGGYTVRRLPHNSKLLAPSAQEPGRQRVGRTCWQTRRIMIAGFLRVMKGPERERRVLLHEMCHVATEYEEPGHGPKWRAEMRRLAREHGESWAAKESQRYKDKGKAVLRPAWPPRSRRDRAMLKQMRIALERNRARLRALDRATP